MRFKPLIQILVSLGLVALPSLALANQNAVSSHPLAVVGFGDSLMSGFELPVQDSFTAQLEKALKDKGVNVTIANAGVAGETTTDGLSRLEWSIRMEQTSSFSNSVPMMRCAASHRKLARKTSLTLLKS